MASIDPENLKAGASFYMVKGGFDDDDFDDFTDEEEASSSVGVTRQVSPSSTREPTKLKSSLSFAASRVKSALSLFSTKRPSSDQTLLDVDIDATMVSLTDDVWDSDEDGSEGGEKGDEFESQMVGTRPHYATTSMVTTPSFVKSMNQVRQSFLTPYLTSLPFQDPQFLPPPSPLRTRPSTWFGASW